MDYTIIGSEVNLAARLQSHAELGGILVAHETSSLIKDTIFAAAVARTAAQLVGSRLGKAIPATGRDRSDLRHQRIEELAQCEAGLVEFCVEPSPWASYDGRNLCGDGFDNREKTLASFTPLSVRPDLEQLVAGLEGLPERAGRDRRASWRGRARRDGRRRRARAS